MVDKETAELEAMRAAAMKSGQETAAVGDVSDADSRENATSQKAANTGGEHRQ